MPRNSIHTPTPALPLVSADELRADLAALEAEAMGWIPLGEGAYLHPGAPEEAVIHVVGVPDTDMAGMNLLWLS